MWQKYFWNLKNNKTIGLYSFKNQNEEYYFEILFFNKNIHKISFLGCKKWNDKWQAYFRKLHMISITQTAELDKIIWKYFKKS